MLWCMLSPPSELRDLFSHWQPWLKKATSPSSWSLPGGREASRDGLTPSIKTRPPCPNSKQLLRAVPALVLPASQLCCLSSWNLSPVSPSAQSCFLTWHFTLLTKLPESLSPIWASLVAQMIKNLQCRKPGLGGSPGKGNRYPLQYPCLENSMDRAWQATVHGFANLFPTKPNLQ